MGMLYDVSYPNQRACDTDVGCGYLDSVADKARAEPQGRIGARAVCTNWDGHVLVLTQTAEGPVWQEPEPWNRKEMGE